MKKHKPDLREEDDFTVASMNVEGMPWYRKDEPAPKNEHAETMTKSELRRYTFAAIGAGLAIVAVFGVIAALFLRFCTDVWFR